jgi:hypothetical protein
MSDDKQSPPGNEPIIDLAHLGSQTLGNFALQREILGLFDDHAARMLAEIKAARSPEPRREAAHALVGAARGVGAFAVARAALAVERSSGDLGAGIASLEAEIIAARRVIAEHLS